MEEDDGDEGRQVLGRPAAGCDGEGAILELRDRKKSSWRGSSGGCAALPAAGGRIRYFHKNKSLEEKRCIRLTTAALEEGVANGTIKRVRNKMAIRFKLGKGKAVYVAGLVWE